MPSETRKSWLLGGGYDWRALRSTGLAISNQDGLSLERTRKIAPPAKAIVFPSPRYSFAHLRYDINRKRREVLAYTLAGKLRHRWGPRDSGGNYVPATDPSAWDPVDITTDGSCVFILDRRYQAVFKHTLTHESLAFVFTSPRPDSLWSRISVDDNGCLLLFDDRQTSSFRYSSDGRCLGKATVPWPAPPAIPSSATSITKEPPPEEDPSYLTEGYWISKPLDSNIYNCAWHRIEMALPQLPPGTQIEVKAFAYGDIEAAPQSARDPRWTSSYSVVAPVQPPPEKVKQKVRVDEFLIRTSPGQYLSLLVNLRGDGFGTPVIGKLRVHYPRESYLAYLPPLYSANEPMRSFLDSFLSLFQTEWDKFDQLFADSTGLFDPSAVPEGVAMNYLASWLGLSLEDTWNGERNRRLLKAVPEIYPQRGTVEALRSYVAVYLTNLAGVSSDVLAKTSFPAFVEGFRERQYLTLSRSSKLGDSQPLWSDSVVSRLQLGGLSREGEVELVSTGDPDHDLFRYFAHRFRVYVPAAWVRTSDQETLLRRAIETELPAHVHYDLCLVEAGFRVGIQSTVGLDTIVGGLPPWRLPSEPDHSAPSRPALNGLGYGTVLSCVSGAGPAILDSNTRIEDWILD